MKESTLQLKILAGVPITKSDKIVEEYSGNRTITKLLKTIISKLDLDISNATNREDKTELNSAASDVEDILSIVKTGKQKKAIKLYSELPTKIKTIIVNNIDPKKLTEFKKYFTPITENTKINTDNVIQPEEDMVQCPFCEGEENIPKINFHNHIMEYHVEDTPLEEPKDSEFDINLGKIEPENVDLQTEAEDATVWDKVEDKDENPNSNITDNDKISLPKEIKSSLEKEIKELQKSSESLIKHDYATAEFHNNVANAMIDVLDHLKTETEMGMKRAQVCLTKQQSPILQKFPNDVYKFVIYGGADQKRNTTNSLVSIFKDTKKGIQKI